MFRRTALFSIIAIAAAASGCHTNSAGATATPTPVRVLAAREPSDPGAARYSGTIVPTTQIDVVFKVSGYVRELLQVKGADGKLRKVQEGDVVTAGTVLAAVRDGDYMQKLAAANAQLAEAIANAGQAKIDFDRTHRLVLANAVAVAEEDTATSRRAATRALVEGAEAQVRDAQITLNDTALRSPITGVVTKRSIEVGTFVSPGTPAFTVADTSEVKFVFGAPDTLLPRVRQGTTLRVHVDALDRDLEGRITRVAPTADPKSRTFEVETTIANPDGALKPGFVASVGFAPAAEDQPVVALPLTGVVRSAKDPRGFAVFVVDRVGSDAVVHLRDVTLGAVIGNEVQVVSGLQKNELVVSMGATLLVDGARVRILPS